MFSDDEDVEEEDEEDDPSKKMEGYFDLLKKVGKKKELAAVDHSKIEYLAFRRNLYVQVREITDMKDHEVDALRHTHGQIKVRGKCCPRPIKSFFQCGLNDKILKVIARRRYESPFPIQMQCIPALMAGRDVIGIAETGSGKTLAYLLPMLRHVLDQPPLKDGDGPVAMVIAPTRELTVQIYQETSKFCRDVELRVVAVYGGTGIGSQLGMLRRGCEIVVATPGRLIDVLTLSNGKVTNLRRISILILDEADRMFDMGFEPQIAALTRNIRIDRQTAMFSATFPPHIEALARQILRKPLEVIVGEKGRTASRVTQYVEVRPEGEKLYRLLQLLGEWHEHGSIIIFVTRQTEADELFAELLKYGYQCAVLHGGQDQTDREFTIQDFKDGVRTLLIATSVAARGLDVKAVVLVINYKVPDHLEDYVHRIGRTGRAGNVGVAFTFITPQEGDKAEDLVKALKQSDQAVSGPLQSLADNFKLQCNLGMTKAQKGKGFGGKGFKFTAAEKSRQQQERLLARRELGMDPEGEEEAKRAEDEILIADSLDTPTTPAATAASISSNPIVAAAAAAAAVAGVIAGGAARAALASLAGGGQAETEVGSAAQRAKALAEKIKQAAAMKLSAPPTAAGAIALVPLVKPEQSIDEQAEKMADNAVAHIQDADEREKQRIAVRASLRHFLTNKKAAEGGAVGQAGDSVQAALANAQLIARNIERLQVESGMGVSANATNLGKVPGLSACGYVDSNTGNYVDEVEINDYPQTARYKITHKEVLSRISEETGTVCQIKGQYVPAEKAAQTPLGGATKKLFIEVIGPTPVNVQRAKNDIRMLMEAVSVRQLNATSTARPTGRYNVV
eukprot:GHVS01083865.1.p1 GENE.GHVS01083865.1~~GHVS01083865.1.p1  ORF type:complete len:849 (+),score=135.40 GHVS01083865.1:158-2704(+)